MGSKDQFQDMAQHFSNKVNKAAAHAKDDDISDRASQAQDVASDRATEAEDEFDQDYDA
ncbi:hypothetical protein [Streptomyces sp. ERV7]|uniref:hypothetical protein n=1 Tax=Streptomyces sp. ERV7 TaxID=1322334 RepID=UPI000A6C55C9|nr:hypothetical protein [Streptomyces sp. ERV7]